MHPDAYGIDQVTPDANKVVIKSQAPPSTLPLPTGAATSAKQDSLIAKIPDQAGGKVPVTDALVSGPVGTTVDTPFVGAEDGTARTIISLLKGIKNHIYSLYGALVAGISVTCGWNNFCTDPISVTLVGGSYHAGDSLYASLVEIPAVALANGRGGIIDMVRLSLNEAGKTPRIRVHVFNKAPAAGVSPTIAADNALWLELAADSAYRVGYFEMMAMSSAGNASTDCSRSQEATNRTYIRYKCAANSQSLWVGFETLDAVTITASKAISIVVKGEMN